MAETKKEQFISVINQILPERTKMSLSYEKEHDALLNVSVCVDAQLDENQLSDLVYTSHRFKMALLLEASNNSIKINFKYNN